MSASSTPVSTLPASPTRRALYITGMLVLLGLIPGMGIPGGLMLGVADRFIIAATGGTALRAIGETAWTLSMLITVVMPLPLLPVLAWVGRWKTTSVGVRLAAVLGMIFAWGLMLSILALVLVTRQ